MKNNSNTDYRALTLWLSCILGTMFSSCFFYCILFQFSICFLFCVRELRGDGDGDSGSTAVTIVKLQ